MKSEHNYDVQWYAQILSQGLDERRYSIGSEFVSIQWGVRILAQLWPGDINTLSDVHSLDFNLSVGNPLT